VIIASFYLIIKGFNMRILLRLATIVCISVFNLSAWAVPFTATLPDQTGPISGSFYVGGITSPGASSVGGAKLTFDLIGYGGIDGYGSGVAGETTDTFGFLVNDPTVDGVSFGAWLNMGGSYPGIPTLYDTNPVVNPLNATLVSYTDNGSSQGGLAHFSVDFTLLSGSNSFVFNYGLQSRLGEGWGLSNMVVTADLISAVPESETCAMMLVGLGLMGFVARRRKEHQV
jgi:hypothetical protein